MGSEEGYTFECQHGPDECYGNLVQACTIAHAPDYDATVRLIVCMMSASRPNEAGPDCFQEQGLDYQPILVNSYKMLENKHCKVFVSCSDMYRVSRNFIIEHALEILHMSGH